MEKSQIDSYFEKMASSPMKSKGKRIAAEGQFTVVPEAIKIEDLHNQKTNRKEPFFKVTFRIKKSSLPDEYPEGSTAQRAFALSSDQAEGDMKAFFFAHLLGIDPKKVPPPEKDPALHKKCVAYGKAAVSPEFAADLGLPENFWCDVPVCLETVKTKTKGGFDFYIHNWTPDGEAE